MFDAQIGAPKRSPFATPTMLAVQGSCVDLEQLIFPHVFCTFMAQNNNGSLHCNSRTSTACYYTPTTATNYRCATLSTAISSGART